MTLNLNDGSYRPYRKPNEETNYIHVNPDLYGKPKDNIRLIAPL